MEMMDVKDLDDPNQIGTNKCGTDSWRGDRDDNDIDMEQIHIWISRKSREGRNKK